MATLSEYLGQLGFPVKQASAPAAAPEPTPAADPVKTASDLGAQEAEDLVKVCAFAGDVIGKAAAASFKRELGATDDTVKTASLQDLIFDAFAKAAEELTKQADNVTGTQAHAAVAADQAEMLQINESAAHQAQMAIRAAADAIQSLSQGDEHTATKMFDVAAACLQAAQILGQRSNSEATHQLIAGAGKSVSQAASAASAHVGAAQ